MTRERKQQLEAIVRADDGALAKELEGIDSKEAFLAAFAGRGVTLTGDEADELLADALTPQHDGELDENELEAVAGGISWKAVVAAWETGVRIGMIARMIYDKLKYNDAYRNYNWNDFIKGRVGFKLGPVTL